MEELERFRCDIVGIAETHRLGVEELQEGEYKIITSGREEGEHRRGVSLVLSRVAQKALIGYSPISERIILAKFLSFTGELVVIQVYAPTSDADENEHSRFYDQLQTTLNSVATNKSCVMLLGDFNAKVGEVKCAADGVMGNFGFGRRNYRGEQLINFCGINNLVIANTLFQQSKNNRKWTWESPDGRTRNQIDYAFKEVAQQHKELESLLQCRCRVGSPAAHKELESLPQCRCRVGSPAAHKEHESLPQCRCRVGSPAAHKELESLPQCRLPHWWMKKHGT